MRLKERIFTPFSNIFPTMRLKVHFGWLVRWKAGTRKGSAEEAYRDFRFFAFNSYYSVESDGIFSVFKIPTKT